MSLPSRSPLAGVALAGGRSRRFGGEKAAARLRGRPLLVLAVEHLQAVCGSTAVSAAGDSEAAILASSLGMDVLADPPGAPRGPLAGICAALAWARSHGVNRLAVLPCDVPFAPADLFPRLDAALQAGDGAAAARTPDGLQSLCLVLRTELQPALAEMLARGEHPPVHEWLADVRAREVSFPGEGFANINTREDLAAAEQA